MKKLLLLLLLFILALPSLYAQNKYTISGYAKDSLSTESLIATTIYDNFNNAGTSSNQYGFYSLTLPAGKVSIIYSYIGFMPQVVEFDLQKDTVINVMLQGVLELDAAVVVAQRTEPVQNSTQMSSVNLPVHQVKALPAFLGEVDLMKVLQLMPGVQSGSEGSSGLYVRGGGPDQNLVLLDGVPVYNASHLFGFFSVFNADAINNIELMKGGFPARYGGRTSSVVDINLKEGNMRKFHGEGSIGLVSAKLTVEGPIWKDHTSFIVSARRTYVDLLAKPFINSANKGSDDKIYTGYFFYDLTAKINHRFSDKDRIYLSTYMGDDKFYFNNHYEDDFNKYKSNSDLKWGNITGAFRWNHVFSNKLFANTTLTYSRFRFNTKMAGSESSKMGHYDDDYYKMRYISGIEDLAAKINFDYLPSPNHYIRTGGSVTHHKFSPGAMGLKSIEVEETEMGAKNTIAQEYSLFIEDDFRISSKLKANLGVHWSGFNVNGKFYNDFQPRAAFRYLINDKLSVKASYSRMAQYVHLLAHSGISLPMDLWVPSTDILKPQYSQQVAVGLVRNEREYEISIEGYYKDLSNLLEYKEGASYFDVDDQWENKVLQGNGYSYGVELFIRKKLGKFSGWVGYTLSWSNRQFDKLNFGKEFPYKYDRRHDISVVAIYKPSKRVELSGTWVFGTGNAISIPKAMHIAVDPMEPHGYNSGMLKIYGERNSYRMAAYHRLDLSVSFIKKRKWGERRWVIGIYNAYNRRNPFFIDVETTMDYDYISGVPSLKSSLFQYNLIPIIPSFSYVLKF